MEQDLNRRSDDRDRVMNQRFDTIERDYADLTKQVQALESKLTVMGLEQIHIKDLFNSRLSTIEKGQELSLAEIRSLSNVIQSMSTDADKTPMGRGLTHLIQSVQATCDEQFDRITEQKKAIDDINKWRDRVDGVLIIMKWIGAGGLIALGISILRLIRILP